jgi:hypothetical protein
MSRAAAVVVLLLLLCYGQAMFYLNTFLYLEPKSGCYMQSVFPHLQKGYVLLTRGNGVIISYTKRTWFYSAFTASATPPNGFTFSVVLPTKLNYPGFKPASLIWEAQDST